MSTPLEDLEIYQYSEKLADDIWSMVIEWEYFAKDTIGKQLGAHHIPSVQTSPKGLAGIITNRIRTSAISAAVL